MGKAHKNIKFAYLELQEEMLIMQLIYCLALTLGFFCSEVRCTGNSMDTTVIPTDEPTAETHVPTEKPEGSTVFPTNEPTTELPVPTEEPEEPEEPEEASYNCTTITMEEETEGRKECQF